MSDQKQPRAPRTPRTYATIEKGALELGLQEQRDLITAIETSIDNKLKELDKAAEEAVERAKEAKLIANGKP